MNGLLNRLREFNSGHQAILVDSQRTLSSTDLSRAIARCRQLIHEQHQGKPLLYSPTHSGSFNLQTHINRSSFKISTQFIGEKIYNYYWPTDNMLPNYFTTNVSYKYSFTKTQKFETYIHLNSENIFDTQYQSVYGFPVPGHSYSIAITIKERKSF